MIIRPVTPDDIPELIRLSDVCGFAPRSAEGWQWILFKNPHQADEVSGLVAEVDGRIMAFVGGAVHKINSLEGPTYALCGHTFVAESGRPGHGARLLKHRHQHIRIPTIFTLHNNALSAPIYQRFGFDPVWRERGREYLTLKRDWLTIGLSGMLRRISRFGPVNKLIGGREWFLKSPRKSPLRLIDGVRRVDPYNALDAEALNKFNAKLAGSGKMYGARDALTWQYRLGDPDRSKPTDIFAVYEGEDIAGLLAVSVTKDSGRDVLTLDIEDFVTALDNEGVQTTMLQQAIECAQHERAARIMWRVLPIDFNKSLAERLGFKSRKRSYDSCHFDRSSDWDPAKWQVSVFDGDFWFALRRPPA